MRQCKFCNSNSLIKNGFVRALQRYECKACGKTQVDGDKRAKYDNHPKKLAVILYLEGNGIRRIARILSKITGSEFRWQTVALWLKKAGEIVVAEVSKIEKKSKDIEIVEMDELYSYIKKKQIKSEYGLLSTETSSALLRLR
jgi:transposase-like protein